MEDKHKEVIAKIAKQHKVIIGEDDPLLMILTLYEYMLNQSESRLEQRQREFDEHHEAALTRFNQAMVERFEHWNNAANNKASNTINIGLEQNQEQINIEKKRFFTELDDRLVQQQIITTTAAEKIKKAATLNFGTVLLVISTALILCTTMLLLATEK